MPQAAIKTKEVVVALADILLARPFLNASPLSGASGLYELIVTEAHWARAQIARSTIVCWMAFALARSEVTNAAHFVWATMKLIIGNCVASCAMVTLNVIVHRENLVISIPLTAHVQAFHGSVIIGSFSLNGVAHELGLQRDRTAFEFAIFAGVRG